jgi:hypothetical protein
MKCLINLKTTKLILNCSQFIRNVGRGKKGITRTTTHLVHNNSVRKHLLGVGNGNPISVQGLTRLCGAKLGMA